MSNYFGGVSVAGVKPALLNKIMLAAKAVGATEIYVTSAKREPGLAHNDVRNSNHITGDAIDGYAVINGQRVPIGHAIKSVASQFGLRSGDVPGFDPKTAGGFDPIHVDDGYNVGMRAGIAAGAALPPESTPQEAPGAPAVHQPNSGVAQILAGLTQAPAPSQLPTLAQPVHRTVPQLNVQLPSVPVPDQIQAPAFQPLPINLPSVAPTSTSSPSVGDLIDQLHATIRPTAFS